VQTYFLNDSNNCKTWRNIKSYIEYGLIVPFQLQLKSLTHVISPKKKNKFFIQTNILSALKKANCWNFTFIWKMTRIMLKALVSKSNLYVYQNARWNQRKNAPKIYPPKSTLSCLKLPPHNVLSPMTRCIYIHVFDPKTWFQQAQWILDNDEKI
jgi:hypothetical protein